MTDAQIQLLAKDYGFRKLGSRQLAELKKIMAEHDYKNWSDIQWIKNIQSAKE